MLEKYDDVMNVDEVCEALRMGKNSVYQLLKDNKIHNLKMKRKYFIPKSAVISFLEAINSQYK